MSTLEINIPMTDSQREILSDNHRFKVVCAGRQFGKSYDMACDCIWKSLSIRNGVIWIISPTYRQSGYLFDKISLLCREHKIPIKVKKSNQEMVITFTITNTIVQALSGDNPDALRGQTLNYLIIDEAAMLPPNIWGELLRPMTAVNQCPVTFISTPKGKNWFYDIYHMGLNKNNKHWKSFHFTSYDGIICAQDDKKHHPGRDELDRIKKETDDATWKQEYLAEFLDGAGLVFTHYKSTVIPHKPTEGHIYIAGLDLAKHVDYTVLTIYDIDTCHPVDYLRMSELDWESQIERIKIYLEKYNNPTVYCDSTGVGDAIVERLRREENIDAVGIVFSTKQKQQLIQNLAVMLSKEEILVPDDPIFINEIERYQYDISSTGNFKYSAPSGSHDDCVCSLALVAWGLSRIAKDIGFRQKDTVDLYEKVFDNYEDYEYMLPEFDWSYEDL